jgi:hypothetical protein
MEEWCITTSDQLFQVDPLVKKARGGQLFQGAHLPTVPESHMPHLCLQRSTCTTCPGSSIRGASTMLFNCAVPAVCRRRSAGVACGPQCAVLSAIYTSIRCYTYKKGRTGYIKQQKLSTISTNHINGHKRYADADTHWRTTTRRQETRASKHINNSYV